MSKKITAREFRELLDELALTHKKTGDHTFRMPLTMDDDFENLLGISFEVRETKIQAWAAIPGFGVENPRADSLEFCNLWNRKRISPKVYLDKDGDFIAEQTIYIDEDCSDEFVKTNFITFAANSIKDFFENLNLHLNTGTSPLEEDDRGLLSSPETREKANELIDLLNSLSKESKDEEEDEETARKKKTALDLINQILESGLDDFRDEDEEDDEDEEEERARFNPFASDDDDDEYNPFHFFLRSIREVLSNNDEEDEKENDDETPSKEALEALEQLVERIRSNRSKGKKGDDKDRRRDN